MSSYTKLRQLKLLVRSWLSLVRNATSPDPAPTHAGWEQLFRLIKTMKKEGQWPSYLVHVGEALDALLSCTEIYETRSKGDEEFGILLRELEALFEQLRQRFHETKLPFETPSVEKLCKSIQHEVFYMQGRRNYEGEGKQYVEIQNDEVLACYRRIQNHLQRITVDRVNAISRQLLTSLHQSST
ncbi:hypothetical protein FRC11_011314 [Ceratobasidium sp. 423]|nr:hypothetical protein FRC11_011314 [Ceratobasidium sp. 423]